MSSSYTMMLLCYIISISTDAVFNNSVRLKRAKGLDLVSVV